ncbi:hypothetical protein NL676_026533 [Syzygium grande]|nr:hypothetical protein NL676_026533 [Syzygium grande]
MATTAIQSHAPSLFSLAPVQFNGSGQPKNRKYLTAGVALCDQAATLGHIDVFVNWDIAFKMATACIET